MSKQEKVLFVVIKYKDKQKPKILSANFLPKSQYKLIKENLLCKLLFLNNNISIGSFKEHKHTCFT